MRIAGSPRSDTSRNPPESARIRFSLEGGKSGQNRRTNGAAAKTIATTAQPIASCAQKIVDSSSRVGAERCCTNAAPRPASPNRVKNESANCTSQKVP